MTRTQISLTEDQHRFLTSLSRQTGESISAIIRKAIEQLRMVEDNPRARAGRLFGAFDADRHDVSINHDDVVFESTDRDERGRS